MWVLPLTSRLGTQWLYYSDYRLNFDWYEHPEWSNINAHTETTLQGMQTKLVLLFTGVFDGWLFLSRSMYPFPLRK